MKKAINDACDGVAAEKICFSQSLRLLVEREDCRSFS